MNSSISTSSGTSDGLVKACSRHRWARLGYRSEAGAQQVIEIEPWAVVVRHGRWYLLCRVPEKDAVRAYRVDRVQGVAMLDGSFTPPTGLDPVALLEDHLAVGWEYVADVVIDAPAGEVARCVPRSLGRLEAVDARTSRLTGSTSNPYWYAQQLAVLPAPFRVVGGAELQETTRALGERLLAATPPRSPRA